MNSLLIILGKLVLLFSKTFNLGSGSTWPGHIALETNPHFLKQIFKQNPNLKVVFIAGTNGKTTTSLMLQKILEHSGLKVFRNEAGANLLNGIASSIVERSSILGKLNFDVAIFETDENNFSLAVKETQPFAVLLLNLFRDQLDRYGEVNTVASKWEDALSKLPRETLVVTNGDDPKLTDILKRAGMKTAFFGLDEKLMTNEKNPYDVDFAYCPNCQTKLEYSKISYSHLGKFRCPKCKFENPKTETYPTLPHALFGKYNVYNINAASLAAERAFNVPLDTIRTALKDFKAAFGRQETIRYNGRDVFVLLSKNPAGFNQSINAINDLGKKGSILLALNDRIPDGRDVSWIWDVDFEKLPKNANLFISGDRAYDMGLRIKYVAEDRDTKIIPSLQSAIKEAVDATNKNETLFILPTYSAMLETRKILTGKKIL